MADTETLPGLLSDAGIKMKSWRPGANEKLICPKCGGGRTRELSLSVTIDADGHGYTGKCHRGTCGEVFGARVHDARAAPRREAVKYEPARKIEPARVKYDDRLYEFFSKRGISQETVEKFGCHLLLAHKFPGEMGTHDAVVFPYRFNGEVVNRKYRAWHAKEITGSDWHALPTLFNADAVQSFDEVLWAEGEPDVMALDECGYPQAVSLKDGADKKLRDEDDPRRETDKRFAALGTHADLLGNVKKFILAGDMDAPGLVLREELARRLGRNRCWLVTWPDGCNDANATLMKHGAEAVQAAIAAAEPYPIEGVHQVSGEMLDRYLELPPPLTMTTGLPETDEIFQIPGEGRLIIVTGFPNGGKSPYVMNIMVHTIRKYKRKWLVFSPEMQPMEEFLARVAQILVGKPARPARNGYGMAPMTREERRRAGDWLRPRMLFLSNDAEDNPPTLDMVLEKAADCVLRYGVTDTLIDPFNELRQVRGRETTKTDFIGEVLSRAVAFTQRHGCNVWIIAHPAKPQPLQKGEAPKIPTGYDISDSANWFNKAVLGLTVHRTEDNTIIHVWKAKFDRLGVKGKQAMIEYDLPTSRYVSPGAPR